jgi:hypothetical protein
MDMHATGGRRGTGNIEENQSVVQTGGCSKKSRFHVGFLQLLKKPLRAAEVRSGFDVLRDEHGIAANDAWHPDVMSGIPWPQEAGLL